MLKTYKFRLYPTEEQEQIMHNTCFLCSILYNRGLAERKEKWENEKLSLSAYDQIKNLPAEKQEIPFLTGVHSQVLQDVYRRLDKSFQNFFRRLKEGEEPGYPRFKPARKYDSFTYPQSGFSIEEEGKGGRLKLSKIGVVKIKMHRPICGEIKTLTIRRQAGKWYACFVCETEADPLPKTGNSTGIDFGINSLVATSDGKLIPSPRNLLQSEAKLKRLQRAVSRKKKGSRRRKKAVLALQKQHEKVANQRRDFAFKLARKLLEQNDLVAIEDLQVKNMVGNRCLAKSIHDAAWNKLATILEHKAEEFGRAIVKVDPKNTSQNCSSCGNKVPKTLSARQHNCFHCGLSLDRDVNAALNILYRGLDGAFGDREAEAS